jgi:hypothetical protein
MRQVRRSLFALGFVVSVCAAAPPRVGTQGQVGLGYGAYDFASGGCDDPRFRHHVREAPAHVAITHRAESGLTLDAEGAVSLGDVRTAVLDDTTRVGAPRFAPGDRHDLGYLALRAGYTGRYAGVTAGAGVFFESREDSFAMFSGHVWAGVPDVVYAWGDLLSGPVTGNRMPLAAGLGHARERWAAEVGVTSAESDGDGGSRPGATASFDMWVTPAVSIGVLGAVSASDAWTGMARLGVRFGAAARPAASGG